MDDHPFFRAEIKAEELASPAPGKGAAVGGNAATVILPGRPHRRRNSTEMAGTGLGNGIAVKDLKVTYTRITLIIKS